MDEYLPFKLVLLSWFILNGLFQESKLTLVVQFDFHDEPEESLFNKDLSTERNISVNIHFDGCFEAHAGQLYKAEFTWF